MSGRIACMGFVDIRIVDMSGKVTETVKVDDNSLNAGLATLGNL